MSVTLRNIKLKDIIKNSSMQPTLIRSLILWHGGLRAFCGKVYEFSMYGADTGISFIFTDDSTKFFNRHSKAIKEYYKELADQLYSDGVIEMIASFARFKNYTKTEIENIFYNDKGDALTDLHYILCVTLVEHLANQIINLLS